MKITLAFIFTIALFGVCKTAAASDEVCTICRMKVESIATGMNEQEAVDVLGKPKSKTRYHYNGTCTDDYSATWRWNKKGIDAVMTADDIKGHGAKISKIIIDDPSIKLMENVGVGSTRAQIEGAFGKYQTDETKDLSAKPEVYWVGQACEGIKFEFRNGKASRIEIGATYCDC